MEVPNSPEFAKKTDSMGIPRYGDFIDVWSEGNIFIDDDNLPRPENIKMIKSGA